MKKYTTFAAAATLLLTVGTTTLSAHEMSNNANTKQHGYVMMDTNKDNKISKDEFNAFKAKMEAKHGNKTQRKHKTFEQLDTNKDGFLTSNEMPQHGKHRSGNKHAQIDTNKDNKISKDEFNAFQTKMKAKHGNKHIRTPKTFEQLDTNKDGYLTKDEMKKHAGQHKQGQHKMHKHVNHGQNKVNK